MRRLGIFVLCYLLVLLILEVIPGSQPGLAFALGLLFGSIGYWVDRLWR